MISEAVKRNVKKNKSRVFRRAYIKRMLSTGAFESDWLEITTDVKKFGKITQSLDSDRYSKISFRSSQLGLNNESGQYLDETDERSLWYGYASQQRTLVKIEAGYEETTLGADGLYKNAESPGAMWDVAYWDGSDLWDQRAIRFIGLISGDVMLSANYEVNLTVMPLLEVFRTFPASNLRGFTSTGFTASQFCELLRDQTDGSGNFVFRPFFEDTTTNWNIESTANVYSQLNTATSAQLINANVWDVIEKLAEAENFVAHVSNDGVFNFTSRDSNTTTVAYEFYGLGVPNREYGHSLKKIEKFGRVYSKYYSRVTVQYREENTTTSFEIVEATLAVSGANLAWKHGHRTLQIQNTYIAGSTQAAAIANTVFDNVSSLKRELAFTSTFIPGLNVLDLIQVSYDPAQARPESLWDNQDWGDTTTAILPTDLIWDASRGDSFFLDAEEMNIISVELDLDKLETKIVARET